MLQWSRSQEATKGKSWQCQVWLQSLKPECKRWYISGAQSERNILFYLNKMKIATLSKNEKLGCLPLFATPVWKALTLLWYVFSIVLVLTQILVSMSLYWLHWI